MKPPNVDLHIDRLVLDGFEGVDRARLGAAVEAELARIFAEQGASAALRRGGARARLDGGSFEAAPDAPADALGAQIAHAVYGGLNR